MADQRIQTSLLLDATLSSGYKGAFDSANKLTNDLNKQTRSLEKELKDLGRQAAQLEKIGDNADLVKRDMTKLERQIAETNRAVDKFGAARGHFRNAKLGAIGLKNELSDMIGFAARAALGIAGIGTAAVVGLSPPEELQAFDQALASIRAISPGIDEVAFDAAKDQILDLSNYYGIQTAEIANQFKLLTRNLGFEGAQQTIKTALDFQVATGLAIPEIEDELATARISLGVDTAGEMQSFLGLLQKAYSVGIKLDNLDLGDLETLTARVGTDIDADTFQREFLTTIAFRQVDSFQFADYAAAFQEEIERAVIISPEMDVKDIIKAQQSIQTLEKWGIRAEDGLVGAMRVYQQLSDADQVQFFTELEPILTAMPAEVIARGSEVLPQIDAQVNMALGQTSTLGDAADTMLQTWSSTWRRIGVIGQNTAGILQESFASTFAPVIVEGAQRLFDFLSEHRPQIQNFFEGIRDGITPVIQKVWGTVKTAYPDIKEFATEVWNELRNYWATISPVATAFAKAIGAILRPVVAFVKDHPKLVATVIAGIAAWKAYSIASMGIKAGFDFIAGGVALTQGHLHRLNAIAISSQRELGNAGKVALSTGQKFLNMGKDVITTKFPRFTGVIKGLGSIGLAALGTLAPITAMGTAMWAAIAPALPVILPVIAAIGVLAGLGYIVYRNWQPIRQFFIDNWDSIYNGLITIFPPIQIFVGLANIIRENWQPLMEFFGVLWETIKLSGQVAWEGIKFVALSAVSLIQDAWGGITGFFSGVWEGIKAVFLDSPLAPIFEGLVSGIMAVVAPLADWFGGLWSGISDAASSAIGWITDKFRGLNETLDKWLGWLRNKNKELSDEIKGIETQTQITQPITQDTTQVIASGETSITQDTPNVIIPEMTQPIGDGANLPSLGELNIPSVDIMTPDAPVIETPQNAPYAPIEGSPVVSPSQASNVSTVSNQNTTDNGTVSITNHFTINAGSAEDAEAIRDVIEQVMAEQMAEYQDRGLTQ